MWELEDMLNTLMLMVVVLVNIDPVIAVFLETLATISCSHGYRVCNNHHLSVCLGWLTKVQGLDF